MAYKQGEIVLMPFHKLFTVEQSHILRRFSKLNETKLREALELLLRLFDSSAPYGTKIGEQLVKA
jgi:hypothetical protein